MLQITDNDEYILSKYTPSEIDKQIKSLVKRFDNKFFSGCIRSPVRNTHWVFIYHIIYNRRVPIACACIEISDRKDYSFLARASVERSYRGRGIQKLLINERVNIAKEYCSEYPVVTYTYPSNIASMNSLISCGFKTFKPKYRFAGKHMVYWQHQINEINEINK